MERREGEAEAALAAVGEQRASSGPTSTAEHTHRPQPPLTHTYEGFIQELLEEKVACVCARSSGGLRGCMRLYRDSLKGGLVRVWTCVSIISKSTA